MCVPMYIEDTPQYEPSSMGRRLSLHSSPLSSVSWPLHRKNKINLILKI